MKFQIAYPFRRSATSIPEKGIYRSTCTYVCIAVVVVTAHPLILPINNSIFCVVLKVCGQSSPSNLSCEFK